MNTIDIRPYLDDLERRIDPAQETRVEQDWLAFADKKCQSAYFTTSRPPCKAGIEWPHVMVNDGLKDYDLMILQQLAMASATLENGTGEMLCLRSNYGTGIIPTMFGAESFIMPYETDTLPGSKPFANAKDDVMRIVDAGIIDFGNGLARKVFEMAERYHELIRDYPKISRFVHYYDPDLQGPLPLIEATWGSDFFEDLYDDTDSVLKALDFYTEVYIQFTRKWKALCPDFDSGHAVEWAMLHKGGTIIRNDSAMNISGEMYEEFVQPRDQRILSEFGGGIHFCGKGDHYIDRVANIRNLSCINMSQPDWNSMDKIYANTIDKGIQIIGLPSWEVERAVNAGRPLRGMVHSGASLAAWIKKDS